LIFTLSPVSSEHITVCPFKVAGIDNCPGCGLGRSLIMLLHGDIIKSIEMHPLAVFALLLLIIRIGIVFRNSILFQKRLKWSD